MPFPRIFTSLRFLIRSLYPLYHLHIAMFLIRIGDKAISVGLESSSRHFSEASYRSATHSPSSQGWLRCLTYSTFEIRVIFNLQTLSTKFCLPVKNTNQSISFQWQVYFLLLSSFIYLLRPFSKLKCSHFVEQYLRWQCEKS